MLPFSLYHSHEHDVLLYVAQRQVVLEGRGIVILQEGFWLDKYMQTSSNFSFIHSFIHLNQVYGDPTHKY